MLPQHLAAGGNDPTVAERIDTPWATTGKALKVERVIAGVSLTSVAQAMGVSVSHLSHIESGRRYVSPEQQDRIRATIKSLA